MGKKKEASKEKNIDASEAAGTMGPPLSGYKSVNKVSIPCNPEVSCMSGGAGVETHGPGWNPVFIYQCYSHDQMRAGMEPGPYESTGIVTTIYTARGMDVRAVSTATDNVAIGIHLFP